MCPVPRIISPLQEESEENRDALAPDVRKGGTLPPFAAGSKIDIPSVKLRGKTVLVDETMLPDDLKHALNADDALIWKKAKLLKERIKEALPAGSKKAASGRQVPRCLLLDASTFRDKLIVLNWWLSLTNDERTLEFNKLKATYCTPTVSNERVPPPADIVLATDTQEVLDKFASNSASGKRLSGKRHRTQADRVEKARQLMAKPFRDKVRRIEKQVKELQSMVSEANLPDGLVYETTFIVKRNVATPRKAGITPTDELMLSRPKMIGMFQNEASVGRLFGDVAATQLRDDMIPWFHDENPEETYLSNQAKQRAREKVRTSEETSQVTGHTTCIVSFDEL
jgi:hypothetical protein